MTGTLRVAVVLLVALFSMTAFVGCGGGSGEGNPGGGDGGNESGGGNGGVEEGGEAVPGVDGTWIGETSSTDYQAVMMLTIDQEGQQVTGHSTIAYEDNEDSTYLLELSGQTTSSDGVSLNYETEGESLDIQGQITDSDTDTMDVEMSNAEGSESYVLQRIQTQEPEQMGLAVVQAVYNRDWPWFVDRVSSDVEENLESYEVDPADSEQGAAFSDLSRQAALSFQRDMRFVDEDNEPQLGARVTLDEESVIVRDSPSNSAGTIVEFDYETTTGNGGAVFIRLVEAGTSSSGYSYQIDNISMNYETEDGGEEDVAF